MSDVQEIIPSAHPETITDALATHSRCRGIYVGADDSYDLHVGGNWVAFPNMKAGSVYPIKAVGARHATGDTAPDAGDIIFLF